MILVPNGSGTSSEKISSPCFLYMLCPNHGQIWLVFQAVWFIHTESNLVLSILAKISVYLLYSFEMASSWSSTNF